MNVNQDSSQRPERRSYLSTPWRTTVSLALGIAFALCVEQALAQPANPPSCRYGRIFDGEKCVWPQAGVQVTCVNGWQPVAGGCQPPAGPPPGAQPPPPPGAQPPPPPPGAEGSWCREPRDCYPGLDCVGGTCRSPQQGPWGQAPGLGEERDGARFRGGIALEGGALIVPESEGSEEVVAAAGVQGEFGVQVNHLFAVYAVSGLGAFFNGDGGAPAAELAVLGEFTAADVFSIGLGPEVGLVIPGYTLGGRLHLAAHPVCARGEDGIRRKALTIAADLRLQSLTIEHLFVDTSTTFFAVVPTVLVGYTAF